MNKERIKNTIYEWVKDNYGEAEANDPSWDIDGLAEAINWRGEK